MFIFPLSYACLGISPMCREMNWPMIDCAPPSARSEGTQIISFPLAHLASPISAPGGGGGADNVPKAILEAGRHGCSWSWGRCQRGGPELDRGHWKSWLKHVGKRRTQGPRGGTAAAAAASEVRWQSCGCVGRRTAWQGWSWPCALRLVLQP